MASAESRPARAGRRPWLQTVAISIVAVALFAGLRWLPLSAGSLHYTDFRADGREFLEFCEPGSPQFAPVDRVRSPVTLRLMTPVPLEAGVVARVTARLETAAGKPVSSDDLLVVHTEKLHLLVVDQTLSDYQHIHPRPAGEPGEFAFQFVPRVPGRYRVFADFSPRATGRALYAGTAIDVRGATEDAGGRARATELETTVAGVRFTLQPEQVPLRINQDVGVELAMVRDDGRDVVLEPVMDAPAHLVAFDEACTGFAHLHPIPVSGGAGDRLGFSINLADPGFYRIWAQVKIDGRELFVPFGVRAVP